MALVIQVKTKDNCATLRKWVEATFGKIQKPKRGLQDFSKIQKDGKTQGDAVGKMPYEGNEDEIIVMNAYENSKQINLVFTLPNY